MGIMRSSTMAILFVAAAILIIYTGIAEAKRFRMTGRGVGGAGVPVSYEDERDEEIDDERDDDIPQRTNKRTKKHKDAEIDDERDDDIPQRTNKRKNKRKNKRTNKRTNKRKSPRKTKTASQWTETASQWGVKDDHIEKEVSVRIHSRRFDEAPLVCFLRNEAFGRSGTLRFTMDSVPVTKCTHVVYSYLETRKGSTDFKFRKIGGVGEKDLLQSLADLKQNYPKLKVMFSFGNGHHMSRLLELIGSNEDRDSLAKSIADLVRKYNLDGVNFHLEGPGRSVCDKRDVLKVLSFIKALRTEFGNKDVYITFQLPACSNPNCDAIPKDALVRFLDYVFLMTFDYKLDDLTKTKLTSGLYYYEGDRKTAIESESCLGRWIDAGVPKYKIVPGIATYGRSFTLDDPNNNGVSAKLNQDHPLGYGANFTKTDGYMDYVETCRRAQYFNWTREWVKYAATPYIYYKDQWISYDDKDSAVVKAEWFRNRWFGGIFVWTLDADDYLGSCKGELFPMVDVTYQKLLGYRPLRSRAFSLPNTDKRRRSGRNGRP